MNVNVSIIYSYDTEVVTVSFSFLRQLTTCNNSLVEHEFACVSMQRYLDLQSLCAVFVLRVYRLGLIVISLPALWA
jgi:hypothetical protein